MATQVEAAAAAGVSSKRGLRTAGTRRFTRESSMAKLFASEVAVRVANECVQIHGWLRIYQGLSGGKVLP